MAATTTAARAVATRETRGRMRRPGMNLLLLSEWTMKNGSPVCQAIFEPQDPMEAVIRLTNQSRELTDESVAEILGKKVLRTCKNLHGAVGERTTSIQRRPDCPGRLIDAARPSRIVGQSHPVPVPLPLPGAFARCTDGGS